MERRVVGIVLVATDVVSNGFVRLPYVVDVGVLGGMPGTSLGNCYSAVPDNYA